MSRCYIQYVSKSERPSSGHGTGKGQSLSEFPKRVALKNVLSIRQSHSSPMPVSSVQFSHSVMSSSLRPLDCSTPGFPVLHQLPDLTQTHIHRVGDAIQPSHPLSSPSPPAFNIFQHQGLFIWVSSSHQGAKVLEFQLQHQSFQWILRIDLLYDGLVGSPCCPSYSQESSPTPQFKSINSLALNFPYSPILIFIHDYWKNHNFD